MHHTEEVAAGHTHVEVEQSNLQDGGNLIVQYLFVGPEIAGSVSMVLHGPLISDRSAEAISNAMRAALLDYWSL